MKCNINTEKEGTKVIINYHLLKINQKLIRQGIDELFS